MADKLGNFGPESEKKHSPFETAPDSIIALVFFMNFFVDMLEVIKKSGVSAATTSASFQFMANIVTTANRALTTLRNMPIIAGEKRLPTEPHSSPWWKGSSWEDPAPCP